MQRLGLECNTFESNDARFSAANAAEVCGSLASFLDATLHSQLYKCEAVIYTDYYNPFAHNFVERTFSRRSIPSSSLHFPASVHRLLTSEAFPDNLTPLLIQYHQAGLLGLHESWQRRDRWRSHP